MKSKLHFGLTIGMIALFSGQTFAGEISDWVSQKSVTAGGVAGFSVTGAATAVSMASSRLQNRATQMASAQSSAEIKDDLIEPLLVEKARLEKKLVESNRRLALWKEELEKYIAASHERLKEGHQLKLTKDGLTPEVSFIFKSAENEEHERNGLQRQISNVDKRLAALPKNLESGTYSVYLTQTDIEHIAKARPVYKSALFKEGEAERLLKRAKRLSTVAKFTGYTIVPVTFGTAAASAIVLSRAEKAKAASMAQDTSRPEDAASTGNSAAQ